MTNTRIWLLIGNINSLIHFNIKALENLRLQEKELVKNDNVARLFGLTLLTIVKKKGRAIQNRIKRWQFEVLWRSRCLVVKATPANVENKKTRLAQSFDQLNKIYASNGVKPRIFKVACSVAGSTTSETRRKR